MGKNLYNKFFVGMACRNGFKRTLLSNSKSKNSQNLEIPKLFKPYKKGITEQVKRVANR